MLVLGVSGLFDCWGAHAEMVSGMGVGWGVCSPCLSQASGKLAATADCFGDVMLPIGALWSASVGPHALLPQTLLACVQPQQWFGGAVVMLCVPGRFCELSGHSQALAGLQVLHPSRTRVS